jgi:hypothetical protein
VETSVAIGRVAHRHDGVVSGGGLGGGDHDVRTE